MTIKHYRCRRRDLTAQRRAEGLVRDHEGLVIAAAKTGDAQHIHHAVESLEEAERVLAIARVMVGEDTGLDWLPLKPTAHGRSKAAAAAWEHYEQQREAAFAAEEERTNRALEEREALARLAFGDSLVYKALALGEEEGNQ